MSRVGNRILDVIEKVAVTVNGTQVQVKGPLGTLVKDFSPLISVEVKNNQIFVVRANEEKTTKQLHGTTNSLISNMIEGVSKGFVKKLEIKGVGYKAIVKESHLIIHAGYSHPHTFNIPEDIKVEVDKKATIVTVSGISKEKVGLFASQVRDIRRPNPYSGKGIMYKGEKIRRKEGKAAGK